MDTPPLVAGFGGPESVDTCAQMAGFAAPESVDTSGEMAEYEVAPLSSADLFLGRDASASRRCTAPQWRVSRPHTSWGTSCLNRVFALAGA